MIWDWHHRKCRRLPSNSSPRRTNEWIHKKSGFSSPLIPQKESEPISSDGGFATPWARPEWNTITRLLELRGAHSFLWRASGANLPWMWIFRSPNFPKKENNYMTKKRERSLRDNCIKGRAREGGPSIPLETDKTNANASDLRDARSASLQSSSFQCFERRKVVI